MSKQKIYEMLTRIDDYLFIIETMIKNAQRTEERERESTDKLNKIIMDSYMSHPDNTTGPKSGRWSVYSNLSDRLEKFVNEYATAKGLHARSTGELEKTTENLKAIKSHLIDLYPTLNG